MKGKRPLQIPMYRWEDNIKTNHMLIDIRREGVDWIQLPQGRDQWWVFENIVP
jgi:hypothetical protein